MYKYEWKAKMMRGHTVVCSEEVHVVGCGIWPVVLDVEEVMDTHLGRRLAFNSCPSLEMAGLRCSADGETWSSVRSSLSHR